MTLLISRFESTENPKEKELMGAKSIVLDLCEALNNEHDKKSYTYIYCPVIMFDVNLPIVEN